MIEEKFEQEQEQTLGIIKKYPFKYNVELFNLYMKIISHFDGYFYFDEPTILYRETDILIKTKKQGNIVRQLLKNNWWPINTNIEFEDLNDSLDSTEESTLMYISLSLTDEQKFNDSVFERVYISYIRNVFSISKLDATGFVVVTEDQNIIDEIINNIKEVKEFYEYTNIYDKHIFTQKENIKVPKI